MKLTRETTTILIVLVIILFTSAGQGVKTEKTSKTVTESPTLRKLKEENTYLKTVIGQLEEENAILGSCCANGGLDAK